MYPSLAVLALMTFVLSIPFLFINFNKMSIDLYERNKKLEELIKYRNAALADLDYAKVKDLNKEINDSIDNALDVIPLMVSGCCLYGVSGISCGLMLGFVIAAALTLHTGNPFFGYIAIVALVALLIYELTIARVRENKEKAEAVANGNIYLYKRSLISKILITIPYIYALYIFLVLIGVFASAQ